MTWPLEASSGAVPVWAANWCLLGNRGTTPTSPRNLAASTGPTPEQLQQAGVGLGNRRGDARLITAAIRCSRWRTSATPVYPSMTSVTLNVKESIRYSFPNMRYPTLRT